MIDSNIAIEIKRIFKYTSKHTMNNINTHNIFSLTNEHFDAFALQIYQYQVAHCNVFNQFSNTYKATSKEFTFLPIQLYKTHQIINNKLDYTNAITFKSSGTTGKNQSSHIVLDPSLYVQSFQTCFNMFFGNPKEYCILALLPSYQENGNSSLVYMVEHLINKSNHPLSGFYLHDNDSLFSTLKQLEQQLQKTILFGVTYALLDFAEQFNLTLNHTTIIETGGMKGRRTEITRAQIHTLLQHAFPSKYICSEYGMTELLSQAYMKEDGRFYCPPWMKVLVRDINDPRDVKTIGRGAINIIDLANIHSCSFIATDDIGEVFEDGSFIIQGRLDNSDIRGCSLLAL